MMSLIQLRFIIASQFPHYYENYTNNQMPIQVVYYPYPVIVYTPLIPQPDIIAVPVLQNEADLGSSFLHTGTPDQYSDSILPESNQTHPQITGTSNVNTT